MKRKLKLSFLVYAGNVVFLIVTGLAFQFSNEFFPFHSDVIQTRWQDLDREFQILYLGMMRTEAAGFLSSGVAIAILLFVALRKNELWLFFAMTAIGIVEYLPTFFANYHVSQVTQASPPWQLMLFLIFSLVLAVALSYCDYLENQNTKEII